MKLVQASDFTAGMALAAIELARIPDATVRLHWTDQPYIWHVNDGTEAFVVLDGLQGVSGFPCAIVMRTSPSHARQLLLGAPAIVQAIREFTAPQ